MNGDLKLRLTPLPELDKTEDAFMRFLLRELLAESLLGLSIPHDVEARVRFQPIENGEDDSAYVLGDGKEFEVVIDDRMPFGMCIDFCLHEFAHIHSWERADQHEDHCDEFGKSYALLYRKYLNLYEEFWQNVS